MFSMVSVTLPVSPASEYGLCQPPVLPTTRRFVAIHGNGQACTVPGISSVLVTVMATGLAVLTTSTLPYRPCVSAPVEVLPATSSDFDRRGVELVGIASLGGHHGPLNRTPANWERPDCSGHRQEVAVLVRDIALRRCWSPRSG